MSKKQLNDDFDWELHPELESFVNRIINTFLLKNKFAATFSKKLYNNTSTKFIDWIDHIVIPKKYIKDDALIKMGLSVKNIKDIPDNTIVFEHKRSYLFPILLTTDNRFEITLKPESIDDFAQYIADGIKIYGQPLSEYRYAIINDGAFRLSAVERRGYDGFVIKKSKDIEEYQNALSILYSRKRHFENDRDGILYTIKLIERLKHNLNTARISDAFFRSERAYWQKRNRAGQMQKARQDSMGLGWGNHDHHTYRSSRNNFKYMIKLFESMGYECRERYYAGDKAGWGAQILEHKICNIVVFTDVDMNPEETDIDFAHVGFNLNSKKLGTVGLWVGLHGESVLQAGMHHLEARFDFEKLKSDIATYGVEIMPPFSYFDFLKQAFTVGDHWLVDKKRLDTLLTNKYITKEQFNQFLNNGAIGSHMENLERRQGFKGFNKSSITKIIVATDPRKNNHIGA